MTEPPSASSADGAGPTESDDGPSSSPETPGRAEKALMVGGVIVTLLVLGYVGWHAVSVPASVPPQATVLGTENASDGRVVVHVRLSVPEDRGLVSATVSSECTDPPATTTFSNLPEDSTWRGTLVCPANTTDPTVSVSSWVGA